MSEIPDTIHPVILRFWDVHGYEKANRKTHHWDKLSTTSFSNQSCSKSKVNRPEVIFEIKAMAAKESEKDIAQQIQEKFRNPQTKVDEVIRLYDQWKDYDKVS